MHINDEPVFPRIFGSELKRRIWKFLSSEPEPVSERELARMLDVSHTAVNKVMKELQELNLVIGISVGSAVIWKLNTKAELYEDVNRILPLFTCSTRDMVIRAVMDGFKEADISSITKAYLIGSVAEHSARLESDIDILAIVKQKGSEEAIKEKLQQKLGILLLEKIGNALSFQVYSKESIEKNKPAWLKDAITRGVTVYG